MTCTGRLSNATQIYVVLVFCLCFTGCNMLIGKAIYGPKFRIDREDVTADPSYQFEYKAGQVYELNQDSLLIPFSGGPFKKHFDIFPEVFVFDSSSLRSAYHKYPWYIKFLEDRPGPKGVLVKGTRFEIVELQKVGLVPRGEFVIYPIAEILDGEYTGTRIIPSRISETYFVDETDELLAFRPLLEYVTEVR